MKDKKNIVLPPDKIAEFCRRNQIRRLSLLRDDFLSDSDVDFVVEFRDGATPSFLDLARMERELSTILRGRKVDLRTPKELSRYFRDEVLSTAAVQYAEA